MKEIREDAESMRKCVEKRSGQGIGKQAVWKSKYMWEVEEGLKG